MPKNFYAILPSSTLRSIRFGGIENQYSYLKRTQQLGLKDLRRIQLKKLKSLVRFAFHNIPFYKKKFREAGITPYDINSLADLEKIPIITKNEVRKNLGEIILARKNYYGIFTTSGSTGKPFRAPYSLESIKWRDAALQRAFSWSGFNPFHDRSMGITFPPSYINSPVTAKRYLFSSLRHIISNRLSLYPKTITDNELLELLKLISKFQPKLLRTSPHLLVFLQRFGRKHDLEFPESLRYIYVGGEAFPYKMLKKESKTEIFELYGAIETGLQASDCREHSGLHMNMENSIIQTVNDGEALNYGEKGEIIITDFTNSDAPLIRYNIEDLGIIAEPEKCSCGMQLMKLDGIVGRKIDTLITINGEAINDLDGIISEVNEASFQRGVEQFQIIQTKITGVTVKVVPTNSYSNDTEKIIMMSLKKILGRDVNVKVKVVKRIPHGKKFRYIISKVKNQKYPRTFE